MKDKVILIEMLYEKLEQYSKTTIELYRLKAIDKISDVFASLASKMLVGIFITLFFILFSFGLAYYLGELFGKTYYGFFALSGFYAVIAIILVVMKKKWLEEKLNDYLINQIFKEKRDAGN